MMEGGMPLVCSVMHSSRASSATLTNDHRWVVCVQKSVCTSQGPRDWKPRSGANSWVSGVCVLGLWGDACPLAASACSRATQDSSLYLCMLFS